MPSASISLSTWRSGTDAGGGLNEQVVQAVEALTPAAEARVARRLNILLGAVPLPEMSQAEVDWVFRAKVRLAGD